MLEWMLDVCDFEERNMAIRSTSIGARTCQSLDSTGKSCRLDRKTAFSKSFDWKEKSSVTFKNTHSHRLGIDCAHVLMGETDRFATCDLPLQIECQQISKSNW